MTASWEPPRCSHGSILLGCPHADCPEQSTYIAAQRVLLDEYDERQRQAARDIVDQLLRGAS